MQRIDRPFLLERAVDFIQSIVRYLKLCWIYFRIFDSLATPGVNGMQFAVFSLNNARVRILADRAIF